MSDWLLVFRDTAAPSDPALAAAGARLRDITDLATRSDLEAGALARQSRILGVLTRAAAAVVATPSPDVLLETLLVHLLEAVPAHRGLVALFEEQPPSWALAAARASEGSPPVALDPAVAERVLRAQGAFIAPRVAAEDGAVRSVLCAPLWFSGPRPHPERIAGCVALEGPADPTPFREEHLRLVTAVANLAASRLESLRLREENADKRRLDEDLRGAARIQESLLPEETPALPGWELAGSSRLCSAVGADYYDFSPDAGGLLLALGDVAGKGLAAALLMASLRAAVRALWREEEPLSRVVARVNDNLRQTVPANRFATLFLARVDTATGEVLLGERGPRRPPRRPLRRPPGDPRGHRHHPRGVRGRLVGRRTDLARPRRRAGPAVGRRHGGRARRGERARPGAAGRRRSRHGRRLRLGAPRGLAGGGRGEPRRRAQSRRPHVRRPAPTGLTGRPAPAPPRPAPPEYPAPLPRNAVERPAPAGPNRAR